MELTYKQILGSQSVIRKMLELSPPLTARLAAQMARNARQLNAALDDFNAGREALIAPYQVEGEKFEYESLTVADQGVIDAEYEELLVVEVEVAIHPIKLNDLADLEEKRNGFQIPGEVFFMADFLFEDGDDAAA